MAPGVAAGMLEEESIYNLIPRPQLVPAKPAMHKSKHAGVVSPGTFEMGVKKRQTATLGLPNGLNAPSPKQFLLSHQKEPRLPNPMAPTYKKDKVKPPVPSRHEKPVFGLTSNKNYVTTNAIEVILATPKKQGGEDFCWTQKRDFGQVPSYLQRNKERVLQEREQLEQYLKLREQEETSSHIAQMSEEERKTLLYHLKTKWASVNTAYQKMTFTLDTPAKIQRKESFERQLAEIEKDIHTLEKGTIVLVVDD